jgi:ribosome-interacting GTPase 1
LRLLFPSNAVCHLHPEIILTFPAKLAKLRRELITPAGGGGGGPGIGFDVARTGIASVGFVGFVS